MLEDGGDDGRDKRRHPTRRTTSRRHASSHSLPCEPKSASYRCSGGSCRTLASPRRTRLCSRRTPSPQGTRRGAPGRSSAPLRCSRGPRDRWVCGFARLLCGHEALLRGPGPGEWALPRGHSLSDIYCVYPGMYPLMQATGFARAQQADQQKCAGCRGLDLCNPLLLPCLDYFVRQMST